MVGVVLVGEAGVDVIVMEDRISVRAGVAVGQLGPGWDNQI